MLKTSSDLVVIKPENYVPELEEKVKYYMSITPDLPRNEKKPVRTKEPKTTDPVELKIWRKEEIRRIKHGHFGMSPKMYFWYNYCKIWDIENDTVFRPEYRVAQQAWFTAIEEAQVSKEFGLICVKRRRFGASWMIAADVLHDCITSGLFKVGMTSKSETDAIELFKKVKFLYEQLPAWLRPTSAAGNTQTSIFFGWKEKDETGQAVTKGLQSEIIVKPPTETSWEGYAMRKWVADEAGKTKNLRGLFSMSAEIMKKGFRRVGTPILFGTSGDITKDGKELKEMWYNADIHKLNKFFLGGWMAVDGLVDEYGNDMKEEAIRCIIYERKRREGLSSKEYNDFLQQYPLTVQEAFTSNETSGLGSQMKINAQINSLIENPPISKKGYFRPVITNGQITDVEFRPDNRGQCIIFEDRQPAMRNLYIAGCDPTDHDVADTSNVSELSMFIMKKQDGLTPPKIVFEYTYRPNVPRDYYEQALLALIYYNNAKVLIERNKAGMITYFDERGFKYLLQTTPQGLSRLVPGTTFNIGVYLTKGVKQYSEELISEYIEDYSELIPSKLLLEECQQYGAKNTDRVSAFAMCMVFLREDKTVAKNHDAALKRVPSFGYKYVNGRLQNTKNLPKKPNYKF
jgi:hypothetical protein